MNTLTNGRSIMWNIADAKRRLYEAYNEFDNCTDERIRGRKDSIIHKINSIEIELENLYREAKREPLRPVPLKQGFKQFIVNKLYHVKGIINNGKI